MRSSLSISHVNYPRSSTGPADNSLVIWQMQNANANCKFLILIDSFSPSCLVKVMQPPLHSIYWPIAYRFSVADLPNRQCQMSNQLSRKFENDFWGSQSPVSFVCCVCVIYIVMFANSLCCCLVAFFAPIFAISLSLSLTPQTAFFCYRISLGLCPGKVCQLWSAYDRRFVGISHYLRC